MASTRFDQPAQHRFINTMTPIPFQELAAAAQARQGKLDQRLSNLDAAQTAMDSLKYIANSKDQLKVEEWQRNMATLADDYISEDLSDPEVFRKLRSGFRSIVNPAEVQAIQESYAGAEAYKKTAAQMQARGDTIYNPYDFTEYDTLEAGVFSGSPVMDLGSRAEAEINAFLTTAQVKSREITLSSGRLAIEQYKDIDILNNLIDTESGELLNSPAIQQLMEKEGLDEQGFKQFLSSRAPSYITSKYTGVSAMPTQEEAPDSIYPSTSHGPGMSMVGISDKPGWRGRREIKRNAAKFEEVLPGVDVKGKPIGEAVQDYFFKSKDKREAGRELEFKTSEDKDLFNAYLDASQSYYGGSDYQGLSPKEQINKIEEYLEFKSTAEHYPDVYEYTAEELPEEAKMFETQMKLSGMFANRAVYDISESKNQQLGSARELMDEYPIEKDYTWTPIGRTSDIPRKELSLAKQIEIRDPEGKYEGTYWIAGSDQEKARASFDNQLTTELTYNLLPVGSFEISLGTGEPSEVEWEVNEVEGKLPEYSVRITHEDGSGIDWVTSSNIADLKDQLLQQLMFFSQ